jgi:hypothetical protein
VSPASDGVVLTPWIRDIDADAGRDRHRLAVHEDVQVSMTVDLEELVRRRCEPCFDGQIERIGGAGQGTAPMAGTGAAGASSTSTPPHPTKASAEIVNARHNR